MNDSEKDAMVILLQSLDRADMSEVLRFAVMRSASRMANRRPFTIHEWERFTEWQRRVILFQVRIFAGRAKAARSIRSLTGKAG